MNEKFPSDLELDAFHGGLDCDIDSIIHDELNMGDGGLDFNFEQLITQLPNNPLTIGELRGGLYWLSDGKTLSVDISFDGKGFLYC